MRSNLWLASAVISCAVIANQHADVHQNPCADPRGTDIRNVLTAFNFCKHESVPITLGYEMARLGDEVSASILRGIDRSELSSAENTKGYLCVVRIAFWKPENIARAEDRIPGVSLFVLEYLKEKHSNDADLLSQIDSAEAYIKGQTREQPKTSQDSSPPRHPPE